jgi:hypothetical protein
VIHLPVVLVWNLNVQDHIHIGLFPIKNTV